MSKGPNIDWPGLLKWSLKYSDGTSPTKRMSDEDAEFLRKAIQTAMAMIPDPNGAVEEAAINLTKGIKEDDTATALTALHVMEQYMELDDVCRNLHKLGALLALIQASQYKESIVADKALTVLSFCVANNPPVQKALHELGGMKVLHDESMAYVAKVKQSQQKKPKSNVLSSLSIKKSPQPSPRDGGDSGKYGYVADEVLAKKFLGCLAQSVRHMSSMEKEFVQSFSGVSLLVEAISTNDSGIQQKSTSLIRHLLVEKLISDKEVPSLVSATETVLGRRDIDDTGVQLGEIGASMTQAAVTEFSSFFRKRKEYSSRVSKATETRLKYLNGLPKSPKTESSVTLDMVEHEVVILKEIMSTIAS